MTSEDFRIVMLLGTSRSSRIMYNALCSDFKISHVFIERKQSELQLIRRRIKQLGFLKVFGQLAFISMNRVRLSLSKGRIERLIKNYGLNDAPVETGIVTHVENINSDRVINGLRELKPDAVVVNGTRIISRDVLNFTPAPFINTHMGITTKYRGVHGAYWALANLDPGNCGVTVHLVDPGIDTGSAIYQDRIEPGPSDNFNTYPIHQLAKGIPLMKKALNDVRQGSLPASSGVGPSGLWSHPTLYQYVYNHVRLGVK